MTPDLERHVLGINEAVPLDPEGFLSLSGSDRWWGHEVSAPRPVADLVGSATSFVLLAPGGVGKTTVMRTLVTREPTAVEIDLRILDRGGIRDQIARAMQIGSTIYLDAVDEATPNDPALIRLLQQLVTSPAASRCTWRLACRPAAWSSGLADDLTRSVPGFEQLRLMPLSRPAARALVRRAGADPDEFLPALLRSKLGRLAASPMQLRAAVDQWLRTAELPDSLVHAIQFETSRLLAESDSDRPPSNLSNERRRRLAGRLAALAAFTGSTRFTRSAASEHGTISVPDLPDSPEPDDSTAPVKQADYLEVLGTALFDPAPDASIMYRHHRYVEFLAAEYLVTRGVKRSQLTSLLGVHASGLLPGDMVGIAAWLAALSPDLVADLIPANPLGFAQTGVELPSVGLRQMVVSGLLTRAAAGDLDPAWRIDLAPLSYEGLADDLLQHLDAGPSEPVHVWWIAKLAEVAHAERLVSGLLPLALGTRWSDLARGAVITAIAKLGDRGDLERLRPLLTLGADEDPDDELLADAVEALYPGLLTTDECLRVLRPRRNTHLVGGYLMLLGKFAKEVPQSDLRAALTWASARANDGEDAYGRLLPELLVQGWEKRHLDGMVDALAGLIAAVAEAWSRGRWMRLDRLPWVNGDQRRRRDLAVAVAGRMGNKHWHVLIELGLLRMDDVPWLVSQLPEMGSQAQAKIIECLPFLASEPNATAADAILSIPTHHPGYEVTRSLRDAVPIDSAQARRWREMRDAESQALEEGPTDSDRHQLLLSAMGECERDPEAWWRVAYFLAFDNMGETQEALFSYDLTRRSGWALLNSAEKDRVIASGVTYLSAHELRPELWLARKRIVTSEVLPDWSGAYLLTTLCKHRAEVLSGLDPEVWVRWSPAIVDAWNYDRDEDSELVCRLVDLAPPSARQAVLDAAIRSLDWRADNDVDVLSNKLFRMLCREMASQVFERLESGRLCGALGETLLGILVDEMPESAAPVCRLISADPASSLSTYAQGCLATLEPNEAVDDIACCSDPSKIAITASSLNLAGLDDEHLTMLARQLLDTFPYQDEPPIREGFYEQRPEDEARRVRTRSLEMLTEAGRLEALESLLPGRPEVDGRVLLRFCRSARARRADIGHIRPTAGGFMQLLNRADARLVRHDDDLAGVILEALHEIQHGLANSGLFRDVWNMGSNGVDTPKSEDDISDWLQRQLQGRFDRGLVVDREIQVARRSSSGVGTRIDLTASLSGGRLAHDSVRVVTEAKLTHNRTLFTAMRDQLVGQYLVPLGLRRGIFLVYWVQAEQRPRDWSRAERFDREPLLKRLAEQATELRDVAAITPVVLDMSKPSS